jgi:hypothetical protein
MSGCAATGACGAASGGSSSRMRSTSVRAGVEGVQQAAGAEGAAPSTAPRATPASTTSTLSGLGFVHAGAALANGVSSKAEDASVPSFVTAVAAAPESDPLEAGPASPGRRQRGHVGMRLNQMPERTAAASVQGTCRSGEGSEGQTVAREEEGWCQREEECALQRFQRLFPARISARLVTHTVGRRASESALSSSIIHSYYRLLSERQELAADAVQTGTEAVTGTQAASVAASLQVAVAPTPAHTLQTSSGDAFLGDVMEEEEDALAFLGYVMEDATHFEHDQPHVEQQLHDDAPESAWDVIMSGMA